MGSCNWVERRVYTKGKKELFIVKREERKDVQVYW